MIKKKHIVVCLALLVVCGIVLCTKNFCISDNAATESPLSEKRIEAREHVTGIDVSHHNGLKSVADLPDSVKFVYIKASQGKTFRDPAFGRNYNLFANKAPHKVAIGAYHFFEQEISADEQFNNLNAAVVDKPLDLPVVVDFEFVHYSGKKELLSIQNNLLRLLKLIETKYKKKPLIYCNPRGYKLFIGNDKRLAEYRIWLDAKGYDGTVPNTMIEQKKIIGLCGSKIDMNYAEPNFLY